MDSAPCHPAAHDCQSSLRCRLAGLKHRPMSSFSAPHVQSPKFAIASPRTSQRKMLPTPDKLLRIVQHWNTVRWGEGAVSGDPQWQHLCSGFVCVCLKRELCTVPGRTWMHAPRQPASTSTPLQLNLQALDACAEMAGISPNRDREERFQHDIDISAGYM